MTCRSLDKYMTSKTKTIIQVTSVAALLVIAATLAISNIRAFTATGEEGLQTWYYDESEGELYKVPRETIPPHRGIGGKTNDGARAIVVAAEGECADPKKRRIAYLETYTPEYKQLMEDVRAARAEGRACGRPLPKAESGFYEKNTLVRRVDDPTWYDMTTTKAGQIVAQWKKERGSDGKTPKVCTP